MYGRFAEIYDGLMNDVDYESISKFLAERLHKHGIFDGLVLDLACGTGVLTRLMQKNGYDMTGIDISPEMLSVAREKNDSGILYLEQDMTEFELYGTMRAIFCSLDSFNYLTKKEDLEKTLKLCNNYLDSDGILIFDINSEYKYKNVFMGKTYVYETDAVFYTWENEFYGNDKLFDFFLTFFVKEDDGKYVRISEEQTQRMYSENEILRALKNAGFCVVNRYDGYTEKKACKKSERVVYECKKMGE